MCNCFTYRTRLENKDDACKQQIKNHNKHIKLLSNVDIMYAPYLSQAHVASQVRN